MQSIDFFCRKVNRNSLICKWNVIKKFSHYENMWNIRSTQDLQKSSLKADDTTKNVFVFEKL